MIYSLHTFQEQAPAAAACSARQGWDVAAGLLWSTTGAAAGWVTFAGICPLSAAGLGTSLVCFICTMQADSSRQTARHA